MATTVLGLKTFAASDPVDYNEINDNYNKIDNGVKTALQGRAAHNLLDNSDFRNPVNQRGKTSYSGSFNYSVDRWIISTVSGTKAANITSSGLEVTNSEGGSVYLLQRITKGTIKSEKQYTMACQFADGTISTSNGYIDISHTAYDAINFVLPSGTIIAWAALYEGSYTADTIPAYQPKGYAAELAECQRYYREVYRLFGQSVGNVAREAIILNPPMRVAPTGTVKSIWKGTDSTAVTINTSTTTYSDVTYTGWGNVTIAYSADP